MPSCRLMSRLPQVSPLSPSTPLLPSLRLSPRMQRRGVNTYGILVLQPSFWRQLIPKPLRRNPDDPQLHDATAASVAKAKPKGWNPATFYLVMFMLIGSMGIHLLAEKRDFLVFSQDADRRLARLREVLGKVQNGEAVDVEKELGTGDPAQEKEWEEVMKEIRSVDGPAKKREIKEVTEKQKEEDVVKHGKSLGGFF